MTASEWHREIERPPNHSETRPRAILGEKATTSFTRLGPAGVSYNYVRRRHLTSSFQARRAAHHHTSNTTTDVRNTTSVRLCFTWNIPQTLIARGKSSLKFSLGWPVRGEDHILIRRSPRVTGLSSAVVVVALGAWWCVVLGRCWLAGVRACKAAIGSRFSPACRRVPTRVPSHARLPSYMAEIEDARQRHTPHGIRRQRACRER